MSKINDALNDAHKAKKANQAENKVLKDVLGLLDEIQKPPEEIIRKRQEEGLASLDELGKVRAFDQTYRFETGAQLKSFLGLLESAEKRIEEIRRQASEHNVRIEPKPKTTDGLQQTLADLSRKLESRLEKSSLEKLKLEEEMKERRTKVETLLKQGMAYFADGRIEEGVQVFKELTSEVGSSSQVDKYIQTIQSTFEQIRVIEADFTRLKSAVDKELSLAEKLEHTLSKVSHQTQQRFKNVQSQKVQMEEALQGRQNLVSTFLEKGLEFFDKGNTRQAFEAWKELAAYIENPASIVGRIDELRRAETELGALHKEISKLEALQGIKEPVPAELENSLKHLSTKFTSQIKNSQLRKEQSEAALQDRGGVIKSLLEKGQALLSEKKFEEALEAFNQLAVFTENPSWVQGQVERIRSTRKEIESLEKEVTRLESLAGEKPETPEAARSALGDLTKELDSKLKASRSLKSQTEEALEDRRKLLNSLLHKGRTLLSQNRFEEAFGIFGELAEYTDDPELVKEQIQAITGFQNDLEQVEAELRQLQVGLNAKPSAPEIVEGALAGLNKNLQGQLQRSKLLKTQAEESVNSRKTIIESLLEKGKILFEKGQTAQALETWQELAAYTENPSQIRDQIERIRLAQKEMGTLEKEVAHFQSLMNSKPSVPEDLRSSLGYLSKDVDSKLKNTQTLKSQMEEALEDRTKLINALLQKGHMLQSQDRLEETFEVFSELAEHTDNPALVSEQIEMIRRHQSEFEGLDREVRQLQAALSVKPSAPEIVEEALSKFNQLLQSQLQKSKLLKTQSEEALKTRQTLMGSLLEKGKTFFEEGQTAEALEMWQELAAYTENPSLIQDQIQRIRRARGEVETLESETERLKALVEIKPFVPPMIETSLAALAKDYASQIKRVRLVKAQSEENIKYRTETVEALLQKGKALLEAGDPEAAFEVWQELASHIDNPHVVLDEIQRIRRARGEVETLESETERLKALVEIKPSVPPMIETSLAALAKDYASQIKRVRLVKAQSEENIKYRTETVEALLQKGKALLEAGDPEAAFEVWQELASHIDNPHVVLDEIQRIRRTQSELGDLLGEAAKLESLSEIRPTVPDDLKSILHRLSADFDLRLKTAAAQKTKVEEALEDRRSFVNSLLQKGKTLLSEHRLTEAFAVFAQLSDLTDNPALVREQIQDIQRFQSELQDLEREVRRLETLFGTKSSAPEIVEESLNTLNKNLQSQLQKAKLQRAQVEDSLKNRQSVMNALVEKGSVMIRENNFREAFEAWQELAVYTEHPALIQEPIQRIKKTQVEIEDLKQELGRLKTMMMSKFPLAPEVDSALDKLVQALAEQKEKEEAQILETQEAVRSRQELIDRFLYNARAFYEKNEVDQAITQWENAAGYVDPNSEFKEKINFIKEAYRNLLGVRNELARELHHLTERMNPKPLDLKFVDGVHRSIRTEVKEINVALRAYMNVQKKTQRFTITKPVITIMLLFVLSFLVFWFYSLNTKNAGQQKINEQLASYQTENSSLRSEKAGLVKEIQSTQSQHQDKLAEAQNQAKNVQSQNKKLTAQVKLLKEENLSKDRTINLLSSK